MRSVFILCVVYTLWLTSCSAKAKLTEEEVKESSVEELYSAIVTGSVDFTPEVFQKLSDEWSIGQAPMILEYSRFARGNELSQLLVTMMRDKTEQDFTGDPSQWRNWLWQQDYKPLPGYPQFKSDLYSQLDPKFADYFDNDRKATIRLDEVRWGGVAQDGIPPLHDPKMLTASKATYLGDDNVVFGIEVDGEARAYPKRILAWHEMFTDTIKGVPLAGVY